MAVSKVELRRRMDRLTETCREDGLKLTHQRVEVFRELAGTEMHPDAETIYQAVRKRVPAISRDTVYRTLATLEERGLVRKAEILANKGRYDANMDRHHHFVCAKCGLVRDFCCEAMDHLSTPQAVASLGRVHSSHVQLRGLCAACAGRKR
ncbi:MAG: transcriptional repressor [Sedimentisphaerales bacterium]|nr:transcriptional repressor [Sedimentisphaerales bacterium]